MNRFLFKTLIICAVGGLLVVIIIILFVLFYQYTFNPRKNTITQTHSHSFSITPVVTGTFASESNTHWLITHLILTKLFQQDPLLANWFFNTSNAFVLKGAITSLNATPIAEYTSYAQFSQDLADGQFPKGISWVMYGLESTTNSPIEEKQHPATYLKAFAALAHAHNLKVMEVPGRDLVYVKGADCVKVRGESTDQAYLRCQIPAATQYADIFLVEAQGDQKDVSTYTNLVASAKAQVRSINPTITVMSGLTTDRGDSASQILACWQATHALVSGYWMNSTIPTLSVAEQALNAIHTAGG